MREPLPVTVRSAEAADAEWIAAFLRQRWRATTVAVHGETIDAARLPALVAGPAEGLATYRLLGRDAELVTINATSRYAGTGTALVEALAAQLIAQGCDRLWVTTTNDNLSAVRFYLRRGFRLIQVQYGAVDAARRLKPSIPVVGENGIPLHDELDLCRLLQPGAATEARPVAPWSNQNDAR